MNPLSILSIILPQIRRAAWLTDVIVSLFPARTGHHCQLMVVRAGLLGLGLCLAGTTELWAHSFTADQVNDATVSGGFVVFPGRILGQEFVPSTTSLDVVELMTNDQQPGNNLGTELFVRIRSGSITGPILGTSSTLSLPDGPAVPATLAHFDFASSVPLVPGAVHVLEVVAASGDNRGIFGTGFGNDGYPAGSVIVDGAVYVDPVNSPFDLWFREGPAPCFVIDQVNTNVVSGGFVVPGASPVGQQFVPAASSLDMVELMTNDQEPGNGLGTQLYVRIRSGSITGPILGASSTLSLPDGPAVPPTLAHFDFASSVPLVPGAVHVLEVVAASGDPRGIFGTGFGNDGYAAGSAIRNGVIFTEPVNSPFDLWFREGRKCQPCFVIDQVNTNVVSGGFVVPGASPVGQQFVPAASSLDMVELMTNDQEPGNGLGTQLYVRIRSGSITGPILGTSSTLSLPDGPAVPPTLAHFDFPSSVPLVPGAVHVLEVVAASGDPRGIFGTGFENDGYAAGSAIRNGVVFTEPGNSPFDLWFREGRKCQPPSNRHWLPLLGNAKPGTPGTMKVSANHSNTTVQISIPGIWLSTEMYADRPFTKVELPPVQLSGAGFPLEAGQRGWYDFPEETGYPPLPPENYRNGLEIGVPKPLFPQSALGHKPETAREMEALGIDPAGARPAIPALRGFVAVSRASHSNDVGMQINALDGMSMEIPYPVMPAGFEASDITPSEDGYIAPQLVDEQFYASFQGSYQGTEMPISEVSGMGVFGGVEFRLPLIRVLSPGVISICTNCVLLFKHLKGTEDFTCPISWDSWIFKIPVINGQALRDSITAKGIKIEASRSAHYLILTPRIYRADLNEFALWKQSKGLNVDFAYVGTAAGDDVAPNRTAIDTYIENYFQKNYCHGVYVLIIGDVDVVPAGRSNRVNSDPDGSDADSDHVYEVLGADRFPSLYVGRLSINSSAELKNQLRKILSYERSPVSGDWPTRATLAANSQTDGGCYGVCADFPSKYARAVDQITAYGGYSMPPTFQKFHAGAASAAVTRAVNQDVVDAINAHRGQVLYRGHGSGSAWVSGWDGSGTGAGTSFSQGTHIPLLRNTAYPIVYSIACQNARLRNTESISESWMSSSNGAVAHFGASVNSYTTENHERAKGIFRAIYESGFTRLGPALAEAERISHSATGGGSGWDNNTFCYLLLGDPELTIRRKQVYETFLIGTIAQLGLGSVITVRGVSNAPVSQAFVNVRLASGQTLNGFTGNDGTLALSSTPPTMVAGLDLDADGYGARFIAVAPLLRVVGFERVGGFTLRVEAEPGQYRIERSSNLRDWTFAGTVTVTGSSADFTDSTGNRMGSRFYRAFGPL